MGIDGEPVDGLDFIEACRLTRLAGPHRAHHGFPALKPQPLTRLLWHKHVVTAHGVVAFRRTQNTSTLLTGFKCSRNGFGHSR